ncbi:hypothetical protein V1478_000144 [Vespula squamosa]|uniref:Uncharacterized protein n=1 Tax=Vespula squamosa TaxID=30214 RepID=A0ABD2C8U5_VESSQ
MSVSRILTDSQINSLGSPIILRNIFVLIIMVGIGKQIIKETWFLQLFFFRKDEETCTEQTKANQVQRKKINIIFDDRIIALQQACYDDLQRMEKL